VRRIGAGRGGGEESLADFWKGKVLGSFYSVSCCYLECDGVMLEFALKGDS
jgi:hypothetical protein